MKNLHNPKTLIDDSGLTFPDLEPQPKQVSNNAWIWALVALVLGVLIFMIYNYIKLKENENIS